MKKRKKDNLKPTHKDIDVSNLTLDSYNPRLPKSFRGKTEKEIIDFLLLESSTLELMQAIGENDFFPGEQLLVVSDGNDKETFTVIEGNRRLASVKLLLNIKLAAVQKSKVKKVCDEAKYYPSKIPCIIFSDKEQIRKYLGYRHVTGIKTWKALEKARYLSELKEKEFPGDTLDSSCRKLAKMIGSRKDYVRRVLIGYKIYAEIEDNAFFNIRDLNDTTFHFNYIADSLNRNHITAFLEIDFEDTNPTQNLNKENLKKWTKWLFEKNDQNKTRLIGNSTDLTKLNKVLGDTEALKSFNGGDPLDIALELTDEMDAAFKNYIDKSYSNLKQANKLFHKVTYFHDNLIDDLQNIFSLARTIKRAKEARDTDEQDDHDF